MKYRKTFFLLALLIACLSSTVSSAWEEPVYLKTKVLKVVDGDSFIVSYQSRKQLVRMIGIATPESYYTSKVIMPYAMDAIAYTQKMIEGKTVYLEFDEIMRDKYDRLYAYVWLGHPTVKNNLELRRKMVNSQLLLKGYAKLAPFPPNVRYLDLLAKHQREARTCRRGIWGLPPLWVKETEIRETVELYYIVDRSCSVMHISNCPSVKSIRETDIIVIETFQREIVQYNGCEICRPY